MKQIDVNPGAVWDAVQHMPRLFHTKDLSMHEVMLQRQSYRDDPDYHKTVGKYLSRNHAVLSIRYVDSGGAKGALWERIGCVSPGESAVSTSDTKTQEDDGAYTIEGHLDIGPQYAGDSPFTARMRFHQSWYRAHVLGVPCGTGPRPSSTACYGNMLTQADGERGLNFVAAQAFSAAGRRIRDGGGVVEPFRLMHNMLSSQPLCFNLFAPLANDLYLATSVFQPLLGGDEVARVQQVTFEYAPEPKGEYLNDRTAFDAFVSYQRPDGQSGFVGIEVKLTEPFSQRSYDGPAYRRLTERVDSPWPPAAWGQTSNVAHNQLWRDHLLAMSVLHHQRADYAEGQFMLVRHPEDRSCAGIVAGYRGLLRPEDESFVDVTLDRLVDALGQVAPSTHNDWVAALRLRYLDLGASEAEWQGRE